MERINRRAVIAGASTTLAAMATPSLATAQQHSDGDLFHALKRWQKAAFELTTFPLRDTKESSDEFGTVVKAHDALMLAALACPARTLEGMKAKAYAIHGSDFFDAYGTDDFAKAAGAALLADVVALHGVGPSEWAFPRA